MASSVPGLLTIPREIRDQIWELQYIKDRQEDPTDGWIRPNKHPYMKSVIYLTNRQLNEEHKDNLSRNDKRIDKFIDASLNFDMTIHRHVFGRDLTYPSLESYTLRIIITQDIPIATILKRMIFQVYHMRNQTVHRHNIFGLDVSTFSIDKCDIGKLFLGKSRKYRKDPQECYGWFYLKVDVFELKILKYTHSLIAPPGPDKVASPALKIDKRAQLALDILGDATENEGIDRLGGLVSLCYAYEYPVD